MNSQTITDKLEEIREASVLRTYDEAHRLEKDLWRDVLQAIADGAENPADLAREALKSREIVFTRWYS